MSEMSRYYFKIRRGDTLTAIDDGLDLPDADAAWEEAAASFGEMIRDMQGKLAPGSPWEMNVTDESGETLFKLAFVTESVNQSCK